MPDHMGVWPDLTASTNHHMLTNGGEGMNDGIFMNFRLGVDLRQLVNCHDSSRLCRLGHVLRVHSYARRVGAAW